MAPCTIHDLRRTFCTDLARLGVNQAIVQGLAGHASAATTATYYQNINDDMRRDAVAKLAKRIG
ncbi:MAG: site-specific integrase [Planctomycetes bacterium]|nr:site-specific integrase [Planctomycetota bacterium]